MELEHINEKSFDETVKNEKLLLVDFFATWCGPCKMLSPILETVQDEVKENAKIMKLDIDESLEIAKQFGVMSVPTMIIFKNGEEVGKLIGLRQKDQIINELKKYY